MKKALVLLLVAVTLPCVALGQARNAKPREPLRLGLAECVKRALANSRTLMSERHRLAAIGAQVEQAFWAQFSNFSAEGFFSVVPDKCIDQAYYDTTGMVRSCSGAGAKGYSGLSEESYSATKWGPTIQVEVEGGVPLFTFGKISNAREAVKEAYKAKEAGIPAFEDEVRFQVGQAYEAVSGAREMLYTIGEGRAHLVKAREKVETDLAAQEGTATEVDLLKLKVFEGEVDGIEVQARQIEQTGLAALRFLVGGADRDRIDILDVPQERAKAELGPLAEYKKAALDGRPELKALRHAVRALEAKVDMRESAFFPDLAAVGAFRYGWTPGRPDIDNWTLTDNYNYGPSWGVGLVLSYDLDFGLDLYELDEAKAELAALSTDQQAALEGIMLEVEKTFLAAAAARDGLAALEKSRRSLKGWIAAVTQGHAAGLNSAKDVKDALKEYFTIMGSIYKMTHDYNVGIAELRKVTGEHQTAGEYKAPSGSQNP